MLIQIIEFEGGNILYLKGWKVVLHWIAIAIGTVILGLVLFITPLWLLFHAHIWGAILYGVFITLPVVGYLSKSD